MLKTSWLKMRRNLLLLVAVIALAALPGKTTAQSKVLCRVGATGAAPCATPLPPSYFDQIPASQVEGGSAGRLLVDDGTQGSWLPPGTAGYFLISSGPGLLPSYQPLPSLPPSQISGGAVGRLFIDNGVSGAWLNSGTAGYVLTSNGPAAAFSWQALPASSPKCSSVTILVMGNGAALSSWVSGQYAGIGSMAGSSATTTIGAWRSTCTGTLRNWYYSSSSANPSGAGRIVTMHRAPGAVTGGCGVYAATAVTMTMPLAGQGAFAATSLAIAPGDCILANQNFTLNTGAGGCTTIHAEQCCN